ncbi:23S rRNA pseudouridine2605 synthase [Pseudorhodobacter antarcticus]|uniref:Pseudouridine synthase n=2 Tax=Pseudorhodobacter antarcticus TaxID=1077947 RepID=A0A1H8CQ51_9RHOB|nr:pseudouridine synthase [Pseudorhodobacter antarcticus]SEM96428.1 23S rRNA pseudouridine2605 synthase [Pseudorhodobacter antarcticus]
MPNDTPQTPAQTPEGDRIAKVLSRAGVASRREAERMIELGQVAVNGKIITSPALNVGPRDRITVDGEPIGQPEPARLWLYYKPEGLVTSNSDEKGRDTIFDHLPEDLPRVMSIGRLDLNSEGLLLLTNDGGLKRKLELPSTGWLRKYRVRVKGNPTEPDLEPLRRGITVEGEKFQPMIVVLDRIQGANAWLTIGLREGKNREIRRAMFAINLTVNRLIRVSYGPFRLGEMVPGDVEEVKGRVLRDQLGQRELPEDAVAPAPRAKGPRPANPRPSTARPSGDRPAPSTDARPTGPRIVKPGAKPSPKPGARAAATPDAKPAASRGKFAPKSGSKPGEKSGGRAFASAAIDAPASRSTKPPSKSWAKAAPKPGGKPNGSRNGPTAGAGKPSARPAKPANPRPKRP